MRQREEERCTKISCLKGRANFWFSVSHYMHVILAEVWVSCQKFRISLACSKAVCTQINKCSYICPSYMSFYVVFFFSNGQWCNWHPLQVIFLSVIFFAANHRQKQKWGRGQKTQLFISYLKSFPIIESPLKRPSSYQPDVKNVLMMYTWSSSSLSQQPLMHSWHPHRGKTNPIPKNRNKILTLF